MALRSVQPRLTAQASRGPARAGCKWVYYESFGMKTLFPVVLGVKTIAYLTPKDVGSRPPSTSRAYRFAWRSVNSVISGGQLRRIGTMTVPIPALV